MNEQPTMLIAIIILALMQPVCVILGAFLYYRASQRQSPVPPLPSRKKIDVVADTDGDRNHQPTRIPVKRQS